MIPTAAEFPVDDATDVERDRRVRLLQMGTLAMCALAVVTMYRMWLLGVTSLFLALGATVLVCGLNVVWLRRGGPVERIGNLSVAALFALLVATNSATGGFYDPNFAWFVVLPIAAAFFVDMRSGVYWAGVAIATNILFWQLAGWDIEFPHLIPEADRHVQALFDRLCLIVGLVTLAGSFAVAQRRTERSLASRNRQLRLEAQCVQLLQHAVIAANESDDFDAAIDTCVERVTQTMGWKIAFVWGPAPDGSGDFAWMRVAEADGYRNDPLIAASRELRVVPGQLALGRVVAEAKPRWAWREQLEPDSSPRGHAALEGGLDSALAIPVHARGHVLRIVEFFGSETEELDERLIAVLCDVGEQLARVAERMRLQETVRQSQKLESVGQLAAGIAHEISNPMAYVRANLGMLQAEWCDLLREAKSGGDAAALAARLSECEELIGESIHGVDRTVAIVRDVRDFARDGGAAIEDVDVVELVESALRIATSARPADTTVESDLEPGLSVACLATRMRQVVLNLIVNAMQAMSEGGHLAVRSRRVGGEIVISVADDGHGILPSDREHIFEPFYTTKPAGQGTGLGLYISYEIVRWHGGVIEVDSSPGHGARFTLRLPIEYSLGAESEAAESTESSGPSPQ